MAEFKAAFQLVIANEGEYVNDPQDPGGETKFGISKRSYPQLDIKNLTIDQAQNIYKTDFWDKINGSDRIAENGKFYFRFCHKCRNRYQLATGTKSSRIRIRRNNRKKYNCQTKYF